MSWDLEPDPAFQAKLDCADAFVREEVEPLDLLWPDLVFTSLSDALRTIVDPLKQRVRDGGPPGAAGYKASDDGGPTGQLPRKLAAARAEFADHLEQEVGNL